MLQRFNRREKGFTLIELMVVIAIIGILASIVLVSLNAARNRARDARSISALSQVRTLAETYASTSSNYDQVRNDWTTTGSNLDSLRLEVIEQIPGDGTTITTGWPGTGTVTEYCISAVLNDGTFCVEGNVQGGASATKDEACNATTYICE